MSTTVEEVEQQEVSVLRSKQEITESLNSLSGIFPDLWKQRDTLNAEPIPLPGHKSGYGLGVLVGMRELERGGFVVGLFEDRRGIISSDQEIIPIGQIVLELAGNKLMCLTSSMFTGFSSEYGTGRGKSDDRYFASLAKELSYSGISVGFRKTYQSRRKEVLERVGITPSEFPRNGRKKLEELAHTRRGLGMALLDFSMLIARHTEKEGIQFICCGNKSQGLIRKSGYSFREETNKVCPLFKNFKLPTFSPKPKSPF